jgi:AcrR family transcriptional regulator
MTMDDGIRRRLPRHERETMIVTEAVRFFAEVGFEGQTRALAQRLGVTQPLLYRYFPDKEALIDRVYQHVFVDSWDPAWEALLTDRSRPLSVRLTEFYSNYCRANFSFERVRLLMYAGLKGKEIARRYFVFLRDHLLEPVVRELRAEAGRRGDAPVSPMEIEVAAALHAGIAYMGVRRWVYRVDMPDDTDAIIALVVDTHLHGAVEALRQAVLPQAAQ